MHVKNHNSHCQAFPPTSTLMSFLGPYYGNELTQALPPGNQFSLPLHTVPHAHTRAHARSHAFRQREEAPVRMEQDGRGGVANYMQVSSAGFPSPLLRSTSEEMTASWQALQLEASPSPPPPPPPVLPGFPLLDYTL